MPERYKKCGHLYRLHGQSFITSNTCPEDLYYYRQLTVCNFGVYNLSTGSMKCYVYHEGEAGKGPNKVI